MDTRIDALLAQVRTYSAFADHQRHIHSSADLDAVVKAAQQANAAGAAAVTLFDDFTGERTEVAATEDPQEVRSRFERTPGTDKRTGPGRPRLGVLPREVSLLPRHWEWLATQSGGASAALRRLVDDARKRCRAQDAARQMRDAICKTMTTLAGDQPGFEEALRVLYRNQFERVAELTAAWPRDLHSHVQRLVENAAALHALAQQEAAMQGASPEQAQSPE